MADYFFKIFTSLRNCNVACSPALRLGGASEQLSGLCLQKVHSPLFKLGRKEEMCLQEAISTIYGKKRGAVRLPRYSDFDSRRTFS